MNINNIKYEKYIYIRFCKFKIILSFILIEIILNFIFTKETISIIIPTYNREKYILKSIKSVLNQTYNNIEIIIIDDCSSDNTKNEIRKIKDRRIRYIKLNKNKGASYARNIGIKKAKGKYISFQDSDDIYHFDKLKQQLKNLNKFKSDLDFCKVCLTINKKKKLYFPNKNIENKITNGINIFDLLLYKGNFISTQSILVKKSYIEKYLFDTRFPRLQDYDLVLRIIPNLKVSFTNKLLVNLYRTKDSISSSSIKLKKAKYLFLKKNYNLNYKQKFKFYKVLKNIKKN